MTSLFPVDVICKADEEIGHHKDKEYSEGSQKKSHRYHAYNLSAKNAPDTSQKSSPPAWTQLRYQGQSKWGRGKAS